MAFPFSKGCEKKRKKERKNKEDSVTKTHVAHKALTPYLSLYVKTLVTPALDRDALQPLPPSTATKPEPERR